MEIFIGAVIALATTFGLNEWTAYRSKVSLRWALAAEISTIIALVRGNDYLGILEDRVRHLEAAGDDWTPNTFTIDATQGYFTVFEQSAAQIGLLQRVEAVRIVAFYQSARSLVDTVSRSGADEQLGLSREEAIAFANMVIAMLTNLTELGDRLAMQLTGPKFPAVIEDALAQHDNEPRRVK